MIRRLNIYNFRCLESLELDFTGRSTVLLVGDNGSGKSTIRKVLEILQQIGQGVARADQLISREDRTLFVSDNEVRFEVEATLADGSVAHYSFALAFVGPLDIIVVSESLVVSDVVLISRIGEEVTRPSGKTLISDEVLALPGFFGSRSPMMRWFQSIIVLSPIPALVDGESREGTNLPSLRMADYAAWFRTTIGDYPTAYPHYFEFLKPIMPDLHSVQNRSTGLESKSLEFLFRGEDGQDIVVPFGSLSDGEKCLAFAALVVAASRLNRSLTCFWDEPDNHIGLSEVGHFVTALRQNFRKHGQLIVTSHNPEAIRGFSAENTLILSRGSHHEGPRARWASERISKIDLAEALMRGDPPFPEDPLEKPEGE